MCGPRAVHGNSDAIVIHDADISHCLGVSAARSSAKPFDSLELLGGVSDSVHQGIPQVPHGIRITVFGCASKPAYATAWIAGHTSGV